MAVGTARMAHLSLANSELHTGVHFDDNPSIRALTQPGADAAVLFPGEGATDLAELVDAPPKTLVVIDGTWPQARKLFRQNPLLHGLRRIAFKPKQPGNYRIRREPAEHCVSTIEAVVEVLGTLEGSPAPYRKMLGAFDWMVDQQLAHKAVREGPSRYLKRKPTRARRSSQLPAELVQRPQDLVLVYAEGNAPGLRRDPADQFEPELLQLVALRPNTGERFEAFIAPRHPLAESIPAYAEVDAERLLAGEPPGPVLERWSLFLRPNDVLVSWGYFTLNLLEAEGAQMRPFVDLRLATTKCLKKRTGGVEQALSMLAGFGSEPGDSALLLRPGRAQRRLEAMNRALQLLVQREEARSK